jgi:hypothetical protein
MPLQKASKLTFHIGCYFSVSPLPEMRTASAMTSEPAGLDGCKPAYLPRLLLTFVVAALNKKMGGLATG